MTRTIRHCLSALLPLAFTALTQAQASLPVDPGETVMTCHSGYPYNPSALNGFVVALFDTADPVAAGAPLGPARVSATEYGWFADAFHNEFQPNPTQRWIAGNLGEVFGVCLDDDVPPNIYVAATTVYGPFPFGPGGPGGVYKLDGTTGAISVFAQVGSPSSITGLGNICHDRVHDQYFVSNLDTGLIHRLNGTTGLSLGAYDHGVSGRLGAGFASIPDSASDFTPFGRRVWGLQTHEGRLYYAVWWEDFGLTSLYNRTQPLQPGTPAWLGQPRTAPPLASVSNEIWSVAIDPVSGALLSGTARLEITMPPLSPKPPSITEDVSSPVADIAFGPGGEMIVAERSMLHDAGCGEAPFRTYSPRNDAHLSRVLEYRNVGGTWTQEPDVKWRVGVDQNPQYNRGFNAAGGVDIDCEGALWATGDALHWPSPLIYGLQGFPSGGIASLPSALVNSTSYLVDADHDISGADKTQLGDVEIYDECPCMTITNLSLDCHGFLSFTVSNLGEIDADEIQLTPVSPGLILSPTVIPGTVPGGGGVSLFITAAGYQAGDTICFDVALYDSDNQLCVKRACVTAPFCGCMEVVEIWADCYPEGQEIKHFVSMTFTNLNTEPVFEVAVAPGLGQTFTPSVFAFPAGLAPNASATIQFNACGVASGTSLIFPVIQRRADGSEICRKNVGVQLPYCPLPEPPDTCHTTRIATCCPSEDIFGPPTAQIVSTICNNGTAAKTYAWSVTGLGLGGSCGYVLVPADFTPSSGTIGPVAPGACASVTITVNCLTFGELPPALGCAPYRITFSDAASPASVSCDGRVIASDQYRIKDVTSCCPGGGGSGLIPPIPSGGFGEAVFEVTDASGVGGVLDYAIVSGILDDGPGRQPLSFDGQAPWEPATGMVVLPPFGTATISVEVAFADSAAAGAIENVYVVADIDGDGFGDLASSTAFRQASPPCPGDANGDGVVDFDDLNLVLAAWGSMGPTGDVNGDGAVNFDDLNLLLASWGSVCG